MKERRHLGIILGVFGILIFFASFKKIPVTGAAIGITDTFNFTIFTLLGFLLILVSLIIEKQES